MSITHRLSRTKGTRIVINILHLYGTDTYIESGIKVNDQLVAYATRFLVVRLKKYVWSHHRALKAKVLCDFSSAYPPDHTNVL